MAEEGMGGGPVQMWRFCALQFETYCAFEPCSLTNVGAQVAAEIEAQTTRPSTTVRGVAPSTPSGVHAAACPQTPREKTSLQFCNYSKELNLFLKFQTMT